MIGSCVVIKSEFCCDLVINIIKTLLYIDSLYIELTNALILVLDLFIFEYDVIRIILHFSKKLINVKI